jgi:methyl-accepting chemotaxis protein
MSTFEIVPYLLLAAWLFFSVYYIIKAVKHPNEINPYIFESIPQVFPTIGILGTFIGIAYGLWFFDVNDIEGSIPKLLQGLKTAFGASIFGVLLLIVFSKVTALVQRKNELGKVSDETTALNRLIELFELTDENGNQIKPVNLLRNMYEESAKQSNALKSFSTDLSIKIEAGFEKILNNPDRGVTHELQELKVEIEKLGRKLQDPTTEMTQNVVKDLQTAMRQMIEEFKASVSGSAKSELEQLTILLGQAGGSLKDFPARLQNMTDNLNTNFLNLQEVVQNIARQTLNQSEHSTEQMRKQVEEMSEILKTKVGDLQVGQEKLINKHSENLQVSDQLLSSFNNSIERMNNLSNNVTETIQRFSSVQNELSNATNQFKNISENVIQSTNSFRDSQLKFAEYSSNFIDKSIKNTEEIKQAFITARDVATQYSEKFKIIEGGLREIFDELQTGLTQYNSTVRESVQTYLDTYSSALTKTAESLVGAASKQEDILEDLTEQLNKFNGKKS